MKSLTTLSAALSIAALAACTTDNAKIADTAAISADTGIAAAPAPGDTTGAAAAEPATTGMMDPNAATANDLATIPGVTPEIASAITTARPYPNMVALDKVLASRLTEQQRDSVYARLWTPIDLNTATDAEILLIPGIGSRMLHEFKEYRPYTSMEQFRREIGKYVDEAEVARLERFVVIR